MILGIGGTEGDRHMGLLSWFRGGKGKQAPAQPPAPRSDANQVPDLLEVAGKLLATPQVRAFEEAFASDDRDFLRRELTALAEKAARTFGPEHPDTATVLEQLGLVGRDPAESVRSLEPCLAARTRTLGEAHPDTIRAQHILGFCYNALGQHDKAIPLLEHSLALVDAAGKERYWWLPQILFGLASSYRQTNQLDRAEAIFHRCVRMAEAFAEQDPGNLVVAVTNLANFYGHAKRFDEAEASLDRAAGLLARKEELPWKPVAGLLLALAEAHAVAGQKDRAEAVYLKCVRLCSSRGTLPPPRPWPHAPAGVLTTMMQAGGAPAEAVAQVAAKESAMLDLMQKALFPGRRSGPEEKPPEQPS
jgi:tetratricopeptide (TPR) repeat protein